jgi:colanic acid biosynthesis glycosyl transferase WcaI
VARSGGGIVVPPRNVEAFLGAAESLLDDAERRAELSRHAREYAEKTFDIEAVAARFEEILERARLPKG